jgi:hypothetical protein
MAVISTHPSELRHMRQHVAFLHTSPIHIATFERLVKDAAPALTVEHVVAEHLLLEAQLLGPTEPSLVARVQSAMQSAAASGAALVVCTCSTIGGAAEQTATHGSFVATRIDRAMADRAVSLGPHILIVAALESTLKPTIELIRQSASSLQMGVDIQVLLVHGAWAHFTQGNQEAYVETIVQAVRASAQKEFDAIVLAQASMAPAARALSGFGVEILSSPEIGVQNLVARFNNTVSG